MRFASILLLALLLIAAPAASYNPFFQVNRILTATDLVDTDQSSAFQTHFLEHQYLWCRIEVTAIAGGGSVQPQFMTCALDNLAEDGCVDDSDAVITANMTAISAPGAAEMFAGPINPANDYDNAWDLELLFPVPPLWLIRMNESGSTTLSYTVDCVQW